MHSAISRKNAATMASLGAIFLAPLFTPTLASDLPSVKTCAILLSLAAHESGELEREVIGWAQSLTRDDVISHAELSTTRFRHHGIKVVQVTQQAFQRLLAKVPNANDSYSSGSRNVQKLDLPVVGAKGFSLFGTGCFLHNCIIAASDGIILNFIPDKNIATLAALGLTGTYFYKFGRYFSSRWMGFYGQLSLDSEQGANATHSAIGKAVKQNENGRDDSDLILFTPDDPKAAIDRLIRDGWVLEN